MERNSLQYQTYLRILERELVPAMGCTEPIAIAYCAAKARAVLGKIPDTIHVIASGNIIKNVKSVIVPNTNGGRGIEVAAAVGVLGGDESKALEVIASVSDEVKQSLADYLKNAKITVCPAESEYVLDITVRVSTGGHCAEVRAVNEHTNLVLVSKDNEVLEEKAITAAENSDIPDYTVLSVNDIYEFANTANVNDVKKILDRQIEMNSAISAEGLNKSYGANIGKVLLDTYGNDVRIRARACAAAGSDARMNGCELPVVINSGSGNQGMTTSLPVIEFAKELGVEQEKLYRALLLSNLLTLHQKTGIGRLSAYCGAVSAGAGAGAGIAYLKGANLPAIKQTLINALAITSGIICDGAKSSCAAKIATAVDAGILGYEMCQNNQRFCGGDGIVEDDVESTIRNVGILGKVGMRETDRVIMRMMTGQNQ
ncbi:serine dehydratase subunit alpha family protein [Pygmaiobacter massiliensis]|uniref:L-cysteine desulfidase family protein n=1 Tax=Pygmaiobacter massiliensis TaxID=1917873 RepID=UPI000C7B0E47|nr:L-serine ammonia-lyase, iron-sulfur-dependent, subunit alpha [Pygmaiobacter massiliensis]